MGPLFPMRWSMWVTGRSGQGGTLWSTSGTCVAPSGRSVSSGAIWPVTVGSGGRFLIVVWNEEVEAVFHELGRAAGLMMLTATMDRLRRFGPAGNSECWSMYGQRVYLGSWGGGASGV